MRRVAFLGIVLTFALVMAACTPAAPATQIPTLPLPVTGNTPRPAVVITATSADTEATSTAPAPVESPTGEATTDTTTPGTTTDTSIRIGASTSTSVREPFLVDQTGRVLYLFTQDTQNSETSACNDECATNWPPVIVKGIPSAGSGVNTGLLGAITRDDGAMQATYGGWPLYYYSGDRTPGAMNGQGMENSWFLVSATGNPIRQ